MSSTWREGALGDAFGRRERRQRACFFEKADRFTHDFLAFHAAVAGHAAGHDLGVLLRGGAGEIDFGDDLGGEVGGGSREGQNRENE